VTSENLAAEEAPTTERVSEKKEVHVKMKQPQQLERAHFLHLKRLMLARRETMPETIDYLIKTHDLDSDKDWLVEWYKPANPSEMHNLTLSPQQKQDGIDIDRLKRAIQDLPQWIKSLTDRITTSDYSFSKLDFQGQEVQGVTLNKTTFYDNAPVTYRDEGMYRVLHDTFPKPMSVEEYRMLNMAQSQYSTLLEDPLEYSMPKTGQIAVDAGAFIGYKAVAFGRAVSPLGKVYAFEIDPFNFNLMKEVIKANNMQDYVHPVLCALAPEEGEMEVMTRDPGSMGHSMMDFDGFSPTEKTVVKTRRLDSVFKELGLDYVDVLHVSVNGFERQVLEGLGDFVHKVGVFNVQAPYSVGGVNLEESIKEYFEENNIKVYGKAQAAVVAGPEAKYYKYR
jgi:FkbM family methyltransferase